MAKEIALTKDGGFYYRALFVHWAITLPCLPIISILLILAIINPFWFRESFFRFAERATLSLARWRDKVKYRIYLGADPEVWHALKDKND